MINLNPINKMKEISMKRYSEQRNDLLKEFKNSITSSSISKSAQTELLNLENDILLITKNEKKMNLLNPPKSELGV